MELTQRLVFCKQCKKKKFDLSTGVICSLTARKPDFEESCSDFVIDPKEAQKIAAKAYIPEEEKSSKSVWVYIGVGLLVLRILIRLVRD